MPPITASGIGEIFLSNKISDRKLAIVAVCSNDGKDKSFALKPH